MTSKEALGLLASRVQVGAYKEEMQKCFDIVNEAINKLEARDTPMKLIENRVTDFNTHNQWGVLHCPKCSCVVVHSTYLMPQTLPNYCEECGQRITYNDY